MKTFREWFKEHNGVDMSHETVNGEWFAEWGLPMIVSCTCCGGTMVLPSAMVDEEGYTYCTSCAGEEN